MNKYTTINVPTDLVDRLHKEANRRGALVGVKVPMAAILRALLAEALDRQDAKNAASELENAK